MSAVSTDTEDEAAIREAARAIAARCPDGAEGGHDRCWQALHSSGFTELRAAEDGAPAATVTQTAVVVEELARTVCAAPLLGTTLATELARLAGAAVEVGEPPRTVLLGPGLDGLGRPADGVAFDAGGPVRSALTLADGAPVVVDLGPARPTQDLTRCVAPPEGAPRSGGPGEPGAAEGFLAVGRTLLAADLLGAAGGVFDGAVEYSRQRVQFGAPIGSFQAVQHLLARAYSQLEGLRSTVLHAAWALDSGAPDAAAAAAVAKAHAGRVGRAVAQTAVQVYGGVAITWEFPAHLHLRRVLLDDAVLGTADALAGALLDDLQGAPDGLQ